MALEIKQSLRLSQQLVMTPQLQQAIKLLQLNRLELVDVITSELMENPLLEEVAETLENPEGLSENATDQERAEANADTASLAEPEMPEQTAKEATKLILALKPTQEDLCEVIFEQDNLKTEFEKRIYNLQAQVAELKSKT